MLDVIRTGCHSSFAKGAQEWFGSQVKQKKASFIIENCRRFNEGLVMTKTSAKKLMTQNNVVFVMKSLKISTKK